MSAQDGFSIRVLTAEGQPISDSRHPGPLAEAMVAARKEVRRWDGRFTRAEVCAVNVGGEGEYKGIHGTFVGRRLALVEL